VSKEFKLLNFDELCYALINDISQLPAKNTKNKHTSTKQKQQEFTDP